MTDSPPRNIVVCCDGTSERGDSNLVSIYGSLDDHDERQLSFFEPYRLTWVRWIRPEIGIRNDTIQAYEFLAHRFRPGDRIFLFGSGKGAITVHVLATVLFRCGLVKETNLDRIDEAFDIGFVQQGHAAVEFKKTFSADCVPHFIGLLDAFVRPTSSVSIELPAAIPFAYQAIALDDTWRFRKPFIWDKTRSPRGQVVEQVWFPGVHGDVAGLFPERGLSDCSLKWMVERAANCGLLLKPDWQLELHPDPAGPLHQSAPPLFAAFFSPTIRVPGEGALVHESVIQRKNAIPNYGSTLPARHVVVQWQADRPLDQLQLEADLEAARDAVKNRADDVLAWEKIAGILQSLNRTAEYVQAVDRVAQLRSNLAFESNLSREIRIASIETSDLEFFGSFRWNFAPRINVLLGKNGYGKSHVLTLIVMLLQRAQQFQEAFVGNRSPNGARAELRITKDGGEPESIRLSKVGFEEASVGKIPVLAISELRFIDKTRNDFDKQNLGDEADLKAHGSDRFLGRRPMGELIQDFIYRVCLTRAEQRTLELPIIRLYEDVVRRLTSTEFRIKAIDRVQNTSRYRVEVLTEGNDTPLPLQQASQGTLSVMAIVSLIVDFLQSIYPTVREDDVRRKPAIVIVDELDAHLHPSWQRKLLGILRSVFPEVQFLIAAHSPLIVAGCKEGEVTVMRRATDGAGFRVEQLNRHFVGATTAELYNLLFEIEEKDETYLQYAAMFPFREDIQREAKQLESRSALTTEEAGEYAELIAERRTLADKLNAAVTLFNRSDRSQKENAILAEILRDAGLRPETTNLNVVSGALTMAPARAVRLEALEAKQKLPVQDEKRLNRLYEDLYYLSEFERVDSARTEEQRRENAATLDLQERILESAPSESADGR